MAYEAKTKPTALSVAAYLDAIEDETRRKDCVQLAALMTRVTGCEPRMWGTAIVGFGSYHYRYESGHEGDSCLVGFASRKGDISIYLMGGYAGVEALLERLGRHRIGKACLYVKRLGDVQMPVLEQLVVRSVDYVRQRYPTEPVAAAPLPRA